jgi:hypothetical protein
MTDYSNITASAETSDIGSYLLHHAFLELQPSGTTPRYAYQFGKANDAPSWDVCERGVDVEGKEVMFTN